jgi:hypothetical protein
MLFALFNILKQPKYLLLSISVSILVFSLSIWLPNISLITSVFELPVGLGEKLNFLFSLYGSIGTNFTIVSALTVVLISVLFGVQVSVLLVYYQKVKSVIRLKNLSLVGILGLVSGFFGIGCTACGAVLATSILSAFGAVGLLSYLPFGGGEFGFVGVVLLAGSILILLRKIKQPLVCNS